MKILSIDPGPCTSGAVVLDSATIPPTVVTAQAEVPNEDLLRTCGEAIGIDRCVIERIASYGMPVGEEIFETVRWAAFFEHAFGRDCVTHIRRLDVKTALCHSAKANDASIRQALIDLYGGPGAIKSAKKSTKKTPGREAGALHGVSGDAWAALAVGITYLQGGATT